MLAATKLRVPVWRPVSEHGRADLVFEIGGRPVAGAGQVGATEPSRRRGHRVPCVRPGARHGVTCLSTYTEDEVDLFGVYCGDLDRCFLLPGQLLADRTVVYLRLTPARNGQRACINLADDFTFDGAVAQLARATRWQRVGQGFESPQLHSNSRDPALTIGADVVSRLVRLLARPSRRRRRRRRHPAREADDQAHGGDAGLGASRHVEPARTCASRCPTAADRDPR